MVAGGSLCSGSVRGLRRRLPRMRRGKESWRWRCGLSSAEMERCFNLSKSRSTITWSGGLAITRVEGQEVDRRTAQAGSNVFDVYLKPVTAGQNVTVTVSGNGATQTQAVELKPVRKMLIYALPHSIMILATPISRRNVEEKQIRNITRGIELALAPSRANLLSSTHAL